MVRKQTVTTWSLALILMIALAPAASADGIPTVVGSWEAVSTLETGEQAPGLFTFNIDRTWMSSGNDASFGNGHGAWKRTGFKTFSATNKAFVFDADGTLALVLTNDTDLEVSSNGQSFTATFSTEAALPDGTVVDSFTGTSTGSRITVD